jgi:ComF family protein
MEDRQSLICPECQDVVREYYLIREPVCKKCGKEVSIPEQEFCLDCSMHSHNFEQAICVFRYGRKMLSVKGIEQFPEWKKKTFYLHSMGESLQYFKYKNAKEYADYYIRELIGQYGVWLRQIQADAIVPVPIHWTRKRRRGYNQAKILSDKLSKILDVPVLDGYLKRIHRTSPQKGLGRQQRTKNLMEAFAVTRALPKSMKTVLLIDDIYTTGATMEVCSRRLKQAGVEKVYCVSICGGQE